MSRWLLYLAQWGFFAVRWLAALLYRVLHFLSSRGALFIVPVVAAVALVQFRPELHLYLTDDLLPEFRPGHTPSAASMDVLLAVLLALAFLAHGLLARLLHFPRLLLTPLLGTAALLMFRSTLHTELTSLVQQYPLSQMPGPVALDVLLVVLLLLAFVLYRPLSHGLWIVLGTFPPLNWPLPPQRPLTVKLRRIRSVVVRMAVPSLPKRWLWF